MVTTKSITVAGQAETAYLFSGEPNRESGRVRHALKTQIARSLSDRETRARVWSCIRSEVEYTFDLDADDAALLRTVLYDLGTSRVLVPLWHDYRLQTDWANRYYDPQYILDVEAAWIYAASDIGLIATDHHVVPLLLCRMRRPEVEAHDVRIGSFPITFEESSPWDWRVDVRDLSLDEDTWPNGLDPDWDSVTDLSKDRLDLKYLGESREPVLLGSQAPMRWGQQATFTLAGADLGVLLSFFAHGAMGRYHAFTAYQIFRPHSSATTGTPNAYAGRLADDELVLDFEDLDTAVASLRFWQVPWELNPPAGESFEVGRIAYLYELGVTYPVGGTVYQRWTGHEAALIYDSNSYSPANLAHSSLKEETGIPQNKVTLEVEYDSANPLVDFHYGFAQGRAVLRIIEADPGNVAGTAREIFQGEVGAVTIEDQLIRAEFGNKTYRKVPRAVIQRFDNRGMFTPESGYDKANYESQYDINTDGGTGIWLDWTGGVANPAAGYFTGGWIEKGSGSTYEARMILSHVASPADGSGADAKVDIDRPFKTSSVGEAVRVYPGYDGQWSTAKSKYNASNLHLNFLGFPYIPIKNPSQDETAPFAKYPGKK